MQKNIKIKVLKYFKKFFSYISFSIFFLVLNSYADENLNDAKKDNDLEFLPGEEVITNTGKKMKVWSSKGTFKLESEKQININGDKESLSGTQAEKNVVVVVKPAKKNDRYNRR